MEQFFLSVSSSALAAAMLAMGLSVIGRRLRPAVIHVLWVLVLIRLFVPPVAGFAILPAAPDGTVELAGMVAGPAVVSETGEDVDWDARTLAEWGLLGLWVLGSLFVGAVVVVRLRRFRRIVAEARPAGRTLVERAERLARAVGCSRQPRILVTEETVSPLVWGGTFGRPCLILPRDLLDRLNDGEIDAVLAHELAHLKRGDDRIRWVELAAQVVFWWNPTTWLASRRLRDAEEACCDAIVTAALPDRIEEYARALVGTVRHLGLPESSPLVAASGLGRSAVIERRIVSMFSGKTSSSIRPASRFLLVLVALAVLGLSPMLKAGQTADGPPEQGDRVFFGQPISLELKDADIRDVLKTFEQLQDLEFDIDPDIDERVTIELNDVPWDQALDMIIRSTGLKVTVADGVVHVSDRDLMEAVWSSHDRLQIVGELDGRPYYRYSKEGTMTEPRRVAGPAPPYPEAARTEGIEGVVMLDLVIGEDGAVRDVEIIRAPAEILGKTAAETVHQWTFEPATLDGEPVAVRYTVTIKFKLDEGS